MLRSYNVWSSILKSISCTVLCDTQYGHEENLSASFFGNKHLSHLQTIAFALFRYYVTTRKLSCQLALDKKLNMENVSKVSNFE